MSFESAPSAILQLREKDARGVAVIVNFHDANQNGQSGAASACWSPFSRRSCRSSRRSTHWRAMRSSIYTGVEAERWRKPWPCRPLSSLAPLRASTGRPSQGFSALGPASFPRRRCRRGSSRRRREPIRPKRRRSPIGTSRTRPMVRRPRSTNRPSRRVCTHPRTGRCIRSRCPRQSGPATQGKRRRNSCLARRAGGSPTWRPTTLR